MRVRSIAGWCCVAMLSLLAGGCNRNAVDPNLPAITTQPTDQTAKVGATATFTVVATGQAPLSYQWFEFAKPIKGATSASYTTPPLASSDNNAFFFVLVTNSIGSIESDEVLLTVTTSTPPPGVTPNALGNANPADVLTMHNDGARTGHYLGESVLTPANVSADKFGKLGTLLTDGEVDAQPLYASGVTLPSGQVRNILYVATEHGTVYAFDAATGSVLWQVGLAAKGEQPADSGSCNAAPQERAISATPVIDRMQGQHGAMYVIASTKNVSGTIIQRIHAIDIATGTELFGGPTPIGNTFDPDGYHPLSGMELINGNVYALWGTNCDAAAQTPWVIGFDAANLSVSGTLSVPASAFGGSEFTATGLAADSSGNLFVHGQAGEINQVLTSTSGTAPATGPDTVFKLSTDNGIGLVAVFVSAPDATVKIFTIGPSGLPASASNQTGDIVRPADAQISFSANGTSDEIEWTIEQNSVGVLRAFEATDLSRELYNSTQAPNSRDEFAVAATIVSPTIAGGRVYLVTKGGIVVFGKLK